MENNQNGTEGKTALAQTTNTAVAPKPQTLMNMLNQEMYKKRFEDIMGKRAAGFISSIISAVKTNKGLSECPPESIISAAVIAATLNLPIQNNLGFAALVPYESKGTKEAQFQMMWRGYVQLAMRTAQYITINVSEVYEGELISENRITGEYVFDTSKKKSDNVVGYVAYFKMVNGFYKYFYWTVAQITAHAKKYSQTFRSTKEWVVKSSRWTVDFDAMAKKTVLKLLLGRFGILSVDMEMALTIDQGVIKDAETLDVDYVDNTEEKIDKEAERIKLMLEDCKSIEDVDLFVAGVPGAPVELINARKSEIDPKWNEEISTAKLTDEIRSDFNVCETIAQVNELHKKYPELHDDKDFKAFVNRRKIEIGNPKGKQA